MSTGLGSSQPVSVAVDLSVNPLLISEPLYELCMMQHLPLVGIELIKQLAQCRLQAYVNPSTKGPTYLAGWHSESHKDGTPFKSGELITQTQANELLYRRLQQSTLPILKELPNWDELNQNQQGALLSLAHSLNNDLSVLSPKSMLGRTLAHRRWYQVPTIIRGYHGQNQAAQIAYRRQEEAQLFLAEIRNDSYTVINRSRLLLLSEPMLIGEDVRCLQTALVQKGYEIDVDGIFGPLTRWAIEKFQRSVALTINGIADVDTQRVLYARPLFMTAPYLIGSDVREVQSALARMGYAVDVNGVFNPRTLRAVMAFQKYFDLPEDGIVKGETLTKLLNLPEMATVS